MGFLKDMVPCTVCGEEVNTSVAAIITSNDFIYLKGSPSVPICKKCCRPLRVRFKHRRWSSLKIGVDPDSVNARDIDDPEYSTEHISDPIKSLTPEEAGQNIAEIRNDLKQVAERIGAGNYEVYLKVEFTQKLELGALEFGIEKQKKWNGKIVVEGLVQKGMLAKGDDAVLLKNGVAKPITLVDVFHYDDEGSFHHTAKAYHGKHEAEDDTYCWIITSEEDGIEIGDVIAIPNGGVQPQPFPMPPQMEMQPQGMAIPPQMEMQPQGMAMQPPPMEMQQQPAQASPKFCRHCGQPLSPGVKFCTSCGGQIR